MAQRAGVVGMVPHGPPLQNQPDDNYEHMRAIHCNQAWMSLYEIDSKCRSILKHGTDRFKTVEELAEYIRTEAGNALHQVEE